MTARKTIIVTGASSGIGAHCARALRDDGWRVFATARRAEDIAALEAEGIEAFFLDYRADASIGKLVADVLSRTGGTIDALYNNGGQAQVGAVEDLPVEALREQFEVNLFGVHDLTRRLIPVMRGQGHGRIVNCSSMLGLAPVKWRGAYSASKHALEALTMSMRAELAGSGIHVSLIEPGLISTSVGANALPLLDRNVDWRNSVHRSVYERLRTGLASGGKPSLMRRGPDAVYRALRHALTSARPRPHYPVTLPAWIVVVLRRLLPARLYYRLLT